VAGGVDKLRVGPVERKDQSGCKGAEMQPRGEPGTDLENEFGAIGVEVGEAGGLELDCDATLALKLHVVEELLLHFALLHGPSVLEHAVHER